MKKHTDKSFWGSRTPRIVGVLVAITLLAVGCGNIQNREPGGQNTETQTEEQVRPVVVNNGGDTTLKISNSAGQASAEAVTEIKGKGIQYKGVEGKTALELLKAMYKVETKTFAGMGEFVDSINGMQSDDSHFWSFYVNGKQSTVGAGTYVTKSADVIEWRYEAIK